MRCVLLVHAEHLAALQALDFQLTLLDELYNGEEVSYIRNVILIGRYNYIRPNVWQSHYSHSPTSTVDHM